MSDALTSVGVDQSNQQIPLDLSAAGVCGKCDELPDQLAAAGQSLIRIDYPGAQLGQICQGRRVTRRNTKANRLARFAEPSQSLRQA